MADLQDAEAHEGLSTGPVFVTGATGYVGGRLVPRLLAAGYRVRCLARAPRKLAIRPWSEDDRVDIVEGSVEDVASLTASLRGCRVAYYLVHSMLAAGASYAARDRELAQAFATAAAAAGVERIIYLGGLGETGAGLSEHLASRREVEAVLESTGIPVTLFRAAMIIGSGSASFEILRYLVERLPAMVTPKWVQTRVQPIAVRNVLNYLVDCLRVSETCGQQLEIGGADTLTYAELMHTMSAARGLPRRWVFSVPLLTPRLSSLWIHIVTPISRHMARPLAEGLRNEVVCSDDRAQQLMPQSLLTAREAIDLALLRVVGDEVESTWSAAGTMPGDPDWAGGKVFVDRWTVDIAASAEEVYRAVCRVGGGHGYYAGDWLWKLRGIMDRFVGGPGLRRGRRASESVGFGEALDFWRVTDVVETKKLELHAEMKLPGVAGLCFEVVETEIPGVVRLVQTARFIPRGLSGLLYGYSVLPLHGYVFRGMLAGIRDSAQSVSGRVERSPIQKCAEPELASVLVRAEPGGDPLPSKGPRRERDGEWRRARVSVATREACSSRTRCRCPCASASLSPRSSFAPESCRRARSRCGAITSGIANTSPSSASKRTRSASRGGRTLVGTSLCSKRAWGTRRLSSARHSGSTGMR